MALLLIRVVLVLLSQNRAETAVRLFKCTWSIMAKALADEGYAEKVTVRQAGRKWLGQGIANSPFLATLLWR